MIKRLFFLLLLFSSNLFSLNIIVSLGEDSNSSYSLLEVDRKEPFSCEHIEATHTKRDYIKCEFGKLPLIKPEGTENSFFTIKPYVIKQTLFIEIIPKYQVRLFPKMIATLEDKNIYKKELEYSKKWFVLGYKKKLPYLKKKELDGINFPIKIKEWDYPTIGTLDVGGFPIGDENNEEFIEYNALKRLYDREDYRTLIARIDRKLRNKEVNKLFMPEILAFKIKALSKQKKKDREIVETGAPWVKAYTSHKDLPNIMLIVAKSYQDMGIIKESNNLLDTLIKEYPGDSNAELAMIYKGDKLITEGKSFSAKKFYEKVLYSSDDIEVASIAASRLGKYYLINEDAKQASDLYKKILKSNPKFFVKDIEESFRLAKDLADRKVPDVAATLADNLFQSITNAEPSYRDIILSAARWYKNARNYEKSMEFYERYLDEFSFVKNIAQVRVEIDYLKFDMDIGTVEERLKFYDNLIGKYPQEEIANNAVYKKMLLFVNEGMYDKAREFLPIFESLDKVLFENLDEEVKRIARKLIKVSLEKRECRTSVELIHKYKILLPDTYDFNMYSCAMASGDFDLAIDISSEYIDELSPVDALTWQKRELDALFRKSNYIDYVLKGERVARIERALDKKADKNIYFKLFEAYVRLGLDEKLIPFLTTIEKDFKGDNEILDLYKYVVESTLRLKNFQDANQYAIKLLNGQRLLGVNTFTSFVEFAIADSAKEIKEYTQGISVLEDLTSSDITKEKMFEALFKLGELYSLDNQEQRSQETFKKCNDLEGESDWKSLCTERVKN